ncbi:MAG: Transcriptional regulatory protein sin3 [Cirrosporium novae-zelandiae]|nr:MAG: Transcriptional regulatory protein sin3 [Cirrosporium novae-zelandiae]
MNPAANDGWPAPPGSGAAPPGIDQHAQAQQRQMNAFGPSHNTQPGPPSIGGPVLPPPSSPYYSSSQPGGHTLPTLADLHASPMHHGQPPQSYQQAPSIPPQAQQFGPSHSLPSLGQSLQHQSPPGQVNLDREREARDRESRERENMERQRQGEIAAREQEERDRQREQQPQTVQIEPGSIPLHHPVASGSKVHGLLSNMGPVSGSNQQYGAFGPPNGQSNNANTSISASGDAASRAFSQQSGQGPPMQPHGGTFGGNAPHPLPASGPASALAQGQQPILNDALSYLDQVKVRFQDQPDVYNRFLDIMKDFKSQTIDTPGVIERVSTLFAGHANLIQGFNTFLPPGYRIECGTSDDPNAIRVTTPQGSTVHPMPSRRPDAPNGMAEVVRGPLPRQNSYEQQNGSESTWQHPRPMSGAPQSSYNDANYAMPPFAQQHGAQSQPQTVHMDYQTQQEQHSTPTSATLVHQQEQRGVSQLQNAVSAATNGAQVRQQMQLSTPEAQGVPISQSPAGVNGAGGAQAGLERRGPVEFNHAISYVNKIKVLDALLRNTNNFTDKKIKNRFSNQPEIYKQFLEILQTYQRESKPIQDVYAQVVNLFGGAPDLLEDFKQFLPESAAHAKAAAAARAAEEAAVSNNIRTEPVSGTMGQVQTPGKLPPVGNFAPPPSVGKDNKRRKTSGAVQAMAMVGHPGPGPREIETSNMRGLRPDPPPGTNRSARTAIHEPAITSPTLTPALPQPMKPNKNGSVPEELSWFDRLKKAIGNKTTYNEFLKLCNLFNQSLITTDVFIQRAESYCGNNLELIQWLKEFVGWTEPDVIIQPRPQDESQKINLSHCRSYGPSYRLLPKRETQKPCSGRDETCRSVLNDEWASHPTWASEDSGFVAHRKNTYEEQLHRIEEERHDYDHHIESLQATITLLEPIIKHTESLIPEEKAAFNLPNGLGGQSEAIWQHIVKKIYDRENGQAVIDALLRTPAAAGPIVLDRLMQKLEEWRASQREWEKVWREQTLKTYDKSLDHQGISVKQTDKRRFQAKTLTNEIVLRYEEQKHQKETKPFSMVQRHQLEYVFEDEEVLLDAAHLVLIYLNTTHNGVDLQKLEAFFKEFIPVFFGLDKETFQNRLASVYEEATDEDDNEMDIDDNSAQEEHSHKKKGRSNKRNDLLRGVLDRSHKGKAPENGSPASRSRNSTPDIVMTDGETSAAGSPAGNSTTSDATEQKWLDHPNTGVFQVDNGTKRMVPLDEPFKRESFNLYCNNNIYLFFRMFHCLYERLDDVKKAEDMTADDIRRAKASKPALSLGINEKLPQEMFEDTSPDARYYPQIVKKLGEVMRNEMTMTDLEEILRRYFLQAGWKLYTIDKLMSNLVKFAQSFVNHDSKDRGNDIMTMFLKDRQKEETTHQSELNYRQQVERLTKEGDVYRITFNQPTKRTTIQLLKRDDKTVDDEILNQEAKWSYYVSTYTMREPTEGVPLNKIRRPMLKRSFPAPGLEDEDYGNYLPLWSSDGLTICVGVNKYKLFYKANTHDWFVQSMKTRGRIGKGTMEQISEKRANRFKEKFVMNNPWMKDLRKEDVDKRNEGFGNWIKGGWEQWQTIADADTRATATENASA